MKLEEFENDVHGKCLNLSLELEGYLNKHPDEVFRVVEICKKWNQPRCTIRSALQQVVDRKSVKVLRCPQFTIYGKPKTIDKLAKKLGLPKEATETRIVV